MLVLGIETSCDETSVALVQKDDGHAARLIDQIVSSQIAKHQPFGGVVPEIATRQHLLHLQLLTKELFKKTSYPLDGIDGIGVTCGPGLASSLMIGLSFAKGLALSLKKPWVGIDHLEGHLFSPFLANDREMDRSHVALVVSGGHTLLIDVPAAGCYEKIGGTRDDAAGEAFDKVAKMLGLGYPGGPAIEQWARQGNPAAFDLPRGMIHSGDFQLSFSGLKTAVRVYLSQKPEIAQKDDLKADMCASFQQAVIDVLVEKTRRATHSRGRTLITLSGGVSCNGALRKAFEQMAAKEGWEFLAAPPHLSTDNAAMIAAVAACRLAKGEKSPWELDIDPNLRIVNSSVWVRGT